MIEGTRIHSLVELYHTTEAPYSIGQVGDGLERYASVVEQDDYIEVEHKFEQPIGDVTFTGIIDRWAKDGIYDLKTASKSIAQDKLDPPLGKQGFGYFESYGLQATAYIHHIWRLTGDILPFHFLVWRKDLKKNGETYPLKDMLTTRTKFDLKLFEEFVPEVAEDIVNESEYPCTCMDGGHKWASLI